MQDGPGGRTQDSGGHNVINMSRLRGWQDGTEGSMEDVQQEAEHLRIARDQG